MTKYFVPAAIFLLLFTHHANSSMAHTKTNRMLPVHLILQTGLSGKPATEPISQTVPLSPTALPNEPEEKDHAHKTPVDETAHIHHFHKHRVNKLGRHQQKCWFLSQLLLLACHLVLLLIAYLHMAH